MLPHDHKGGVRYGPRWAARAGLVVMFPLGLLVSGISGALQGMVNYVDLWLHFWEEHT